MKIPEIVLRVMKNGSLWMENENGTMDCPWKGLTCGSWCPHFDVRTCGEKTFVRLWCTPQPRDFGSLRVVEPENKETTA